MKFIHLMLLVSITACGSSGGGGVSEGTSTGSTETNTPNKTIIKDQETATDETRSTSVETILPNEEITENESKKQIIIPTFVTEEDGVSDAEQEAIDEAVKSAVEKALAEQKEAEESALPEVKEPIFSVQYYGTYAPNGGYWLLVEYLENEYTKQYQKNYGESDWHKTLEYIYYHPVFEGKKVTCTSFQTWTLAGAVSSKNLVNPETCEPI